MKQGQRFSILRIIAMTMCVVLGCFVFALCAVVGSFAGSPSVNAEARAEGDGKNAAYAQLYSVEIKQKPDWIWTAGQTEEQLRRVTDIVVTYIDPDETVEEGASPTQSEPITVQFKEDGTLEAGVIDGLESVALSLSGNTLTATVTVKSGYSIHDNLSPTESTVEIEQTVSFGTRQENGFIGKYTPNAGSDITTATVATSLKNQISVWYTYNDSSDDYSKGEPAISDSTLYEVDKGANLFPSDFAKAMETGTYSKFITINSSASSGKNISGEVEVTGIEFSKPESISGISGNISGLVARQEIDFFNKATSNITVSFIYKVGVRQTTINVPLAAFTEEDIVANSIHYYADSNGLNELPNLTTAAQLVTFDFTYPGELNGIGASKTNKGYIDVVVDQLPIVAPSFGNPGKGTQSNPEILSYYNGVGTDVLVSDYSQYKIEDPDQPDNDKAGLPEITITVTHIKDGQTVVDSIIEFENIVFGTGETMGVNRVSFTSPNTQYMVYVKLEETGDFQWRTVENGGTNAGSNEIIYYVFVDKDRYTAELNGTFTFTYEDLININSSISATPVDGHSWVIGNPAFEKVEYEDKYDQKDENGKPYEEPSVGEGESKVVPFKYYLVYYKASKDADHDYSADTKLYDTPTNAGKYKVKAVTITNEYYYGAETELYDFTINPKEIAPTSVLKAPTYTRGTEFAVSGNATNDKTIINDANYDYKLSYSITGEMSTTVTYAKKYTVELTIGDFNYVWKDADLPTDWSDAEADLTAARVKADAEFEIAQRVISYTIDTSAANYYYGDIDLSKIKFTLDNESENSKYVKAPTITYNIKGGAAVNAADANKWNKGDYTINVQPEHCDGYAAEASSLKLSAKSADFNISPAEVTQVTLQDGASAEYKREGNTFTFNGWVSIATGKGGLGSVTDIQSLLTRTIDGKRFDGATPTAPVYSDDSPEKVTLKDAGTYKVTVSLPTSGNFVWVGGGNDDVTATWTIKKAVLDKVTEPADVKYNHDVYTLSLDNWVGGIMEKTVTGKTFVGNANITGFTDTPTSKDFALVKAGIYTIEVELTDKNNYEWKDDAGNHTNNLVLTFNINRAEIVLDPNSSSEKFQETADKVQPLPTLKIVKQSADGGFLKADELTLIYTIKDNTGNTVTDNKITKSGVYTYVFTGTSGSEKDNYELLNELTYTHEVLSFNLDAPAFNGADIVYDGENHDVLTLIKTGAEDSNKYEGRIVVTVKKGATAIDGTNIKDVYGEELAYTVEIRPATSYSWKVGEGQATSADETFTFEVKITRRTVNITWGKTEATYGDSLFDPNPTVTNKHADDTLTVTIGYRNSDKTEGAVFTSTTNAGQYYVYAQALGGVSANNYKIVSDCETGYKIYKKGIARPDKQTVSGTYNGDKQSSAKLATIDDSLVSAKVTGYRPGAWFDTNKDTNRTLTIGNDAEFAVNTGVFSYTNAGIYSVKFTIKTPKNYCWSGDDYETEKENFKPATYECDWTDFAAIDRKSLPAPKLGENRSQAWGGEYNKDAYKIAASINDASVLTVYGKYLAGTGYNGTTQNAPYDGTTAASIGQYYIKVTVTETDMLNYVWGTPESYTDGYVNYDDQVHYDDGAVFIYVHYAITGAQLPLTFESIEYVFGANGVGGTIDDLFDVIHLTTAGQELIDSATIPYDAENIRFDEVSFTNDDGSEVDLENDLLPWNVGTYKMTFTVVFVKNSNYQELPIKNLPLEVKARPIALSWTDSTLTKTYDGKDTLGKDGVAIAEITNLPTRKVGGKVTSPVLTVTATQNDKSVTAKNVGSYVVSVTGLTGDNAKNFTVVGATNNAKDFTITQYSFSAKAKDVTGFVYGDTLPSGTNSWTVSNKQTGVSEPDGFNDDIKNIVLAITGAENASLPTVGDYTIALSWAETPAGKLCEQNYDVAFDNTATFEVIARKVTVTLNNGKVETTYYDEENTYKLGGKYLTSVYSAVTTNGTSAAAFVDDKVFELTSDVGKSSNANAAGYKITATQNNFNYVLTFKIGEKAYTLNELNNSGAYKHIVKNAALTETRVSGYSSKYDAQSHDIFYNMNAVTRDGASVTWEYREVGDTTWHTFISGETQIRNVADNASYNVRVSADNHDTYEFEGAISVAVTPVELTVKVDFSIYYGEEKPETADYLIGDAATYIGAENSKYTVDGLKGSDNRSVIGGNISYTTTYVKGGSVSSGTNVYITSTVVSGLASEHGNYTFVSAQGTLTVNKVAATVAIQDKTSAYDNENRPELELGAITVTSMQTYAPTPTAIVVSDWSKIFTLKSGALEPHKNGAHTNKVDPYAIYAVAATGDDAISDNFDVTFTGSQLEGSSLSDWYGNYTSYAFYTIENSELTGGVVTAKDRTYNDLFADALTVSPVSASDGTAVDIKYYVYVGSDAITPDSVTVNDMTNGAWQDSGDAIPQFMNAATYYVFYSFTAENYAAKAKCVAVTVAKKTDNAFDTRFAFGNGKQTLVESDTADGAQIVWTYGKLDAANNPNGYDGTASGGQHATQPVANVRLNYVAGGNSDSTDINKVKITLARYTNGTWNDIVIDSTYEVNDIMLAEFGKGMFGAGIYRLTFVLEGNANYNGVTEMYIFEVGKKALAVTPNNASTDYGEDVEYSVSIAGYVDNGSGTEDLTAALGTHDESELVWDFGASDYAVGDNVGGYVIRVADKSDANAKLFANYTLDCTATGTLTVNPRTVTIEIGNGENHYMLLGAFRSGEYEKEKINTLAPAGEKYTHKIVTNVEGSYESFYNNEVPFTLHTDAIVKLDASGNVSESGAELTNDVGKYAVYAVFTDATAAGNYNIKIANAAYTSDVKGVGANAIKDGDKVGGVFEITTAQLMMNVLGPYYEDAAGSVEFGGKKYTMYSTSANASDAGIYDGRAKHFNAKPIFGDSRTDIPNSKKPNAYAPVYEKSVGVNAWESMTEAPSAAGSYRVWFKPSDVNNNNYVQPDTSASTFTIAKRNISYAIADNTQTAVTYNGAEQSVVFSFGGIIDADKDKIIFHTAVTHTDKEHKTINEVYNKSDNTSYKYVENNTVKVKVTAVDALVYNIAITLDKDEKNYSLTQDEKVTDTLRLTFTVNRATLDIYVQDSSVQYGTPIFDGSNKPVVANDLFDGFATTYGCSTITDIDTIIAQNKTDGNFTKDDDFGYAVEGYTVNHGITSNNDKLEIKIGAISAANFDITGRIHYGKLTIVPREIEITVKKGSETTYDALESYNTYVNDELKANLDAFLTPSAKKPSDKWNGDSGDLLSALNVSFTINPRTVGGSVHDAGDYYISAYWSNENYDVTFKYGDNVLDAANGKAPIYRIKKAELIVKVQDRESVGYDESTGIDHAVVNTVYGDTEAAINGRLTVRFSGWKEKDGTATGSSLLPPSVTFEIKLGETAYAQYAAHVGQKYIITGRYDGSIVLTNYYFTYVDADLNITPLVISASTEDRVFEIADDGYHGGIYGKALEAVIAADGGDVGTFKPQFSLSYNTDASSAHNQEKGKAPNHVGKYVVTVTILPYETGLACDYAFAKTDEGYKYDKELPYNITERPITLAWEKQPIINPNEDENRDNSVNFITDLMTIRSFTLNNRPFTGYNVNAGRNLTVTNAPLGTYVLTVELNAEAVNNYKWNGFVGAQATATFTVTSDGLAYITDFTLSGDGLKIDSNEAAIGWTYGNDSAVFSAKLEDSTHAEIGGANIVIEFGGYTGSAQPGFNETLTDISDVVFGAAMPSNKGIYVARASFAGDTDHAPANPRYYVFVIDAKSVDKPTTELSGQYAENNGVISISAELEGFDASSMRIVNSAVNYTISGNSVTLSTMLANPTGYNITVGLANNNYVWSDDGSTGNVNVVWKVDQGENSISWNPGAINSKNYGDDYPTGDSAITAYNAFSVNGNINYWYALRTEGQTEKDAAAITDWNSNLPENAGKYWIRAVGRSANGNYTMAYGYMAFTVNKVDLDVTPSGSMTYGTAFNDAKNSFTFTIDETMLKNGDLAEVVIREIRNSLSTSGNGYSTDTHTGVLPANSYILTLKAETRNYNIVNKNNEKALTVNKKALDVRIGSASSQYGNGEIANNYRTVSIDLSGLASADSANEESIIAGIREKLVTDATVTSDVSTVERVYYIAVDGWSHANYTLNVTRGVYTITKLPVIVTFENGGGEYGSANIASPSVKNIVDETGRDLTADVKNYIEIHYVGYTEQPTATGRYSFVGTIKDDCNYMLARSAGGTFVISQRELDASLIIWEDVYYDGTVKKPQPTNKDVFDNVNFDTDITITYDGAWTEAGVAYTIKLTLNSTTNTKWKTVEGAEREITYTIKRGTNSLKPVEEGGKPTITIKDWTFGSRSDENDPQAATTFGSDGIRYEYSTTKTFEPGTVLNGLPENAGTYYVRAIVGESANWEAFESEAVEFKVLPVMQDFPTLGVYSETGGGNYKNDTYTGEQLSFEIEGFDSTDMEIAYDGTMITRGNRITLLATNAGTYSVVITLKNGTNYNWAKVVAAKNADGSAQNVVYKPEGSVLTITWTIAKRKLALPTANDNTYIVNGKVLEYIPVGFDPATMSIRGNTSGYGGDFKAYVSIIDTDNYEWEDGRQGEILIEWHVVGADVLFAVLVSILAALTAAAAAFMGVELYRYLKKKKSQGGGKDGSGSNAEKAKPVAEPATEAANAEPAARTEAAENAEAGTAPAAKTNNEGTVTA